MEKHFSNGASNPFSGKKTKNRANINIWTILRAKLERYGVGDKRDCYEYKCSIM